MGKIAGSIDEIMIKVIFVSAAIVMLLAAPASAGMCPSLAQKLHAALEDGTANNPEEVRRLLNEGKRYHENATSYGDHHTSVKTLLEAMKIGGISR